jgi:hypothetical protein
MSDLENKKKKIDCTIKLAISYSLKNFLERLVINIHLWNEIKFSEEFILVHDLNKQLKTTKICEHSCMGCLDYILVNRIFGDFHTKIEETNKKYNTLLSFFVKEYNLDIIDPIELALNLIVKPEYLEKILDTNQVVEYKEYVSDINGIIISLKLSYYHQRITELHDIVLSHGNLAQEQKNMVTLVHINTEIETFYIDQNFIGKYINDNSFQRQIENIKKKVKYQFVFSPYLIEDGIKMNKVFLKEYFENIDLLTDGILVTRYDDKLAYVKEDVDSIVERILLWLQPTKAGENLKFYWSLFNAYAYSSFKRDKKNTLVQNINKDIKKFLQEFDIQSVHSEENEFERSMEKTLYWKTTEIGLSFEEIQNLKISSYTDFDKIDKIQKLCDFLDFINYQTDKEEKKIKSSYQDTEHLKHAWKCKYFITDDDKLIKRGEFIYSILGIETQFLTSDNLKKMMVDFYKK